MRHDIRDFFFVSFFTIIVIYLFFSYFVVFRMWGENSTGDEQTTSQNGKSLRKSFRSFFLLFFSMFFMLPVFIFVLLNVKHSIFLSCFCFFVVVAFFVSFFFFLTIHCS